MTSGWISAVVKVLPRGDVREAHEGMHQGELPRVIEPADLGCAFPSE